MRKRGLYERCFKRLLDILCSGLALIVLSPVFLATAILVRLRLGAPVLFRQERPGWNEQIFQLCKFRSMTDARDESGELLPDEQRLTRFGRLLRSTSLDELPELINILKGDMSVVGPRPLLVAYLPYYTEQEAHRHDVRPGLTGWAQVNGRNVTVWDERLQQDLYYVQNCGFLFDCRIILMTVLKVLRRSDVIVGAQHGEGHGRLDKVRGYVPRRSRLLNGEPIPGQEATV